VLFWATVLTRVHYDYVIVSEKHLLYRDLSRTPRWLVPYWYTEIRVKLFLWRLYLAGRREC